jgi:hypothetical protein
MTITRPDQAATINRLKALQILSKIGMWTWPILSIGTWLLLEYIPASELQRMAGVGDSLPRASILHLPTATFHITWKVKFAGVAISILPAVIQFLFMRQWVELFGLYGKGQVFAVESVRCFSRMGRHLLVLAIYDIVFSMPLSSLVLTLDNPPGKRLLSFGFSSDDIPVLATGIALVVIAWAMDEGRKLQQEADLVV